MIDLLEAVASWQTLLMCLAIFGFAPGFVLRILVRLYPVGDPRRQELVAELYVLNHFQRPLYVAEQLETGLFDGLGARMEARREARARRAQDSIADTNTRSDRSEIEQLAESYTQAWQSDLEITEMAQRGAVRMGRGVASDEHLGTPEMVFLTRYLSVGLDRDYPTDPGGNGGTAG